MYQMFAFRKRGFNEAKKEDDCVKESQSSQGPDGSSVEKGGTVKTEDEIQSAKE